MLEIMPTLGGVVKLYSHFVTRDRNADPWRNDKLFVTIESFRTLLSDWKKVWPMSVLYSHESMVPFPSSKKARVQA
jgi:hypothetical protein